MQKGIADVTLQQLNSHRQGKPRVSQETYVQCINLIDRWMDR